MSAEGKADDDYPAEGDWFTGSVKVRAMRVMRAIGGNC
jgi:hypothetical protein